MPTSGLRRARVRGREPRSAGTQDRTQDRQQAGRQQRTDHAGQRVARPGGRSPRLTGGFTCLGPPGSAMTVTQHLSNIVGRTVRPADGWPDAVVTPRRPGSDCTASLDLSIGPHDVPWRAYHGTGYFGHSRLAKCLAWESAKRYSPQITMTSAMIPRPAIRAAMIPDVSL